MYANLKVRVDRPEGDEHNVYACSQVDVAHDGLIVLYLDWNDGETAYAIPGGALHLPAGSAISVTADF